MQYKKVKDLIIPLISGGHEWQSKDINGKNNKPILYFSNVQLVILFVSAVVLFKITKGISTDVIGYIMSAFSISVSLFMSLLVNIFDKFQNTKFDIKDKTDDEIGRLIQKKNFFKRFISITSYLVILSILIIVLCSITYIFNLSDIDISSAYLTIKIHEIDMVLTAKCSLIVIYRTALNYFLLNYLFLTLFITGSAYDYYMSEMNKETVMKAKP